MILCDVGGSRTRCVLVNESCEVLKVGFGGPGNHLEVGVERMIESIEEATKSFGERAEAFLALAGLGLKVLERGDLVERISKKLGVKSVTLAGDTLAAHLGAFEGRDGILVLAGTGSAVVYRKKGQWRKLGGWGHLLGDEGSGYAIAVSAIRMLLRIWEGLEKENVLLDALPFSSPEEVFGFFYRDFSKSKVASLSKAVLEAAERDDKVRKMVTDEISKLLEHLKVLPSGEISYSGGMFKSHLYKEIFTTLLKEMRREVIEPSLPPLGGLAILAGCEISDETRDHFWNID